ncbi:MAG: LptA/OstA family protein [Candidatus Coatesbacteria bacterium]
MSRPAADRRPLPPAPRVPAPVRLVPGLAVAASLLAAVATAGSVQPRDTGGPRTADGAAPSSTVAAGARASAIELERADRVEYFERERRVDLTGNVKVRFETNVIQADSISVDLDREQITASGHLVWESADLHATGSRMTFDMKRKTGAVDDVTLLTGPWICRGDRVEQPEENTVIVAPGVLSTCVAPRPHYSIRCRHVQIRLNRDLTARSVTVLAGTTPIFWLPVLATPLREFRLPFEAQVGHTRELGAYARTAPAYSFTRRAPGQAHLDYFARTGWGLGITQELLDAKGRRAARVHAYRIRERVPSRVSVPSTRGEVFVEGSRPFGSKTRVAAAVDMVSDPHFREQYGNQRLGLPTTAGERRAHVLVSQELPGASLGLTVERVDTLHLTSAEAVEGRYALSQIHAPQITLNSRSLPLADWLSLSARGQADHGYTWQNGWYVNSTSLTPALSAFGRLRGVGAAAMTTRLTTTARDRGDRVLREDGTLAEDRNRGVGYRAENATSLRRGLAPGLDLDLAHTIVKRLNKVGYDPFRYHGLDVHSAGAGLAQRFGRAGTLGTSLSYDLRNKQDPSRRRWSPLTGTLGLTPVRFVSLSAETGYDLWWRRIRSASGSLLLGMEAGGPFIRFQPRYTDNRLELPAATTTSQDYRLARFVYGASFQDDFQYRNIFVVDADASFPIAPGITVGAFGQWDAAARRVHWYTISVTRNLHCWELVGTFQRYVSGEYRFNASVGLIAFPVERVPLIGL